MYETTVSVPSGNRYLLNYVVNQLEPCVREIDGLSTRIDEKKRSYYSLACSDTYRFTLRRQLVDTAAQTLGLGYKNIFVRSLLKIGTDNFYQNVLVNTVCAFDSEYDRQIISKLIDADKPICLDGYYNFRMSAVKKKWTEIIRLLSDNFYVLRDDQLIVEFLRYLTESSPSKVKKMSVTVGSDGFVLYGTDGKVVPPLTSLSPCCDWREEVALNLLYFKPQRVILYSPLPNDALYRLLNELFEVQTVQAE